jgi:hypothetical protein
MIVGKEEGSEAKGGVLLGKMREKLYEKLGLAGVVMS